MSDELEYFDDVICLKKTSKALLVQVEGEEHWVPKSVIEDGSEVEAENDQGELVVKHWWAEKKGWA